MFVTWFKRDSSTGVFRWILRNFEKRLFWRKSVNGCFWVMSSQFFCPFIWRRCSYVSQHSQENTCARVSVLINVHANLSLSLFNTKFRHWCFPDSYLKFLTTTFLKEQCCKKKTHKNRGSDVYRKSNYATFYSDNGLCIVLSVGKKSPKVVNNTLANGLWRSLTCQNSHADITPLILTTDLINIYALLAFHFLSVSHGPTSILSDILITLRKSHVTIFVGHFWKITNTCERCFWDVLVTSG